MVFQDLDLMVPPAERLAIVGESGAGKSTLLHLLGGLDRPSSGRIAYRGTDIAKLDATALATFRNQTIGFVWQSHHLLPEFTALENVTMPLLIRGVSRNQAASAAQQVLSDVGLADRATHQSGELSGGEQQRVALARALVTQPEVLLADEPTGNLDPATGDAVMHLLEQLQRQRGLTMILVTHNLHYAGRCDRTLRLQRGQLVAA